MSWGERSCSKEKAPKNEFGGCAVAEMHTCNVYCQYYTWDGETRPDSGPDADYTKPEIVKPKEQIRYSELSKSQKKKLRRKMK